MSNESGVVPTGIRVIVRVPEFEEKSAGGIVIPSQVKQKEERANMTGVMVAASEDAMKCREMAGMKVGDTLFFARYAGAQCEWHRDGVMYKVMNATDVIGKVVDEMDSQFRAAQSSIEAFGQNAGIAA